MRGHVGLVVESRSPLFGSEQVPDEFLGDSEATDLVLHGGFQDDFLLQDEGSLFLVVIATGRAAVAIPPVTPSVFEFCSSVDEAGVVFFARGGKARDLSTGGGAEEFETADDEEDYGADDEEEEERGDDEFEEVGWSDRTIIEWRGRWRCIVVGWGGR
jgi:hypothetical protein